VQEKLRQDHGARNNTKTFTSETLTPWGRKVGKESVRLASHKILQLLLKPEVHIPVHKVHGVFSIMTAPMVLRVLKMRRKASRYDGKLQIH
jgi:hypothetical protein